MAKISTQMRFDELNYKKMKYIAEKEFRSINSQLEYFIAQGIRLYEEQNGVIDKKELDELEN